MPKQSIIETPCGLMTRQHAAELSGVSYNTICRRCWEGWPVERLFELGKRGGPLVPRPNKRVYENSKRITRKYAEPEAKYVESWAERKLRRQRERA